MLTVQLKRLAAIEVSFVICSSEHFEKASVSCPVLFANGFSCLSGSAPVSSWPELVDFSLIRIRRSGSDRYVDCVNHKNMTKICN